MKLAITNSVGEKGKNIGSDVKLIRSLINVYRRNKKLTITAITDKCDASFIEEISNYQKDHQKNLTPDGQVTSSNSGSFKSLVAFMKSTRTHVAILPPSNGKLTWKAEGSEGGRYHSRVLHVPSNTSGLTIGRGYDLKQRSTAEIKKHLSLVSIPSSTATKISQAAGLQGLAARQFIIDQDLLDFEISAQAQLTLFEHVYKDITADVKRIGNKTSVIKAYGKTNWDELDPAILDILVDLRFRGDYTGNSRKKIQKSVSNNDFDDLKKIIIEKKNWELWPTNRFDLRKEYLDQVSKEKRKKGKAVIQSGNDGAKISHNQPTGTPE